MFSTLTCSDKAFAALNLKKILFRTETPQKQKINPNSKFTLKSKFKRCG